jgi:hypothetical protein
MRLKNMNFAKPKTHQITLAVVLAAVYFVLRSMPTFQMVGVSGRFTAADFIITGIILIGGLWSSCLSVIIGTILAYAINPPVFFGLDFLPAFANTSIVGLILSNHRRLACGIYVSVLAVFLASPYSLLIAYTNIPYAWLHIFALMVLLSPILPKIPGWLRSDGLRQLTAIAVLALVGTMGQHLTGGLLYEFTVGFIGGVNPSSFRQFWRIIFWIYPVERTLIITLSTIIAMALFRSTRILTLSSRDSST